MSLVWIPIVFLTLVGKSWCPFILKIIYSWKLTWLCNIPEGFSSIPNAEWRKVHNPFYINTHTYTTFSTFDTSSLPLPFFSTSSSSHNPRSLSLILEVTFCLPWELYILFINIQDTSEHIQLWGAYSSEDNYNYDECFCGAQGLGLFSTWIPSKLTRPLKLVPLLF